MNPQTFEYAEDIVSKAMMFAISAHSGQFRKDGRTPAIVHAMEAVSVAAGMTHDPEVLAAVLLHDTVEDTDVTFEQIKAMFGSRVSELVGCETEDKHKEMLPSDSWMLRKRESLETLKNSTDRDVKILWLSDKLSNLRSFYRMHRAEGSAMWQKFHQQDEAKHRWYYETIAAALSDLNDTAAYEEYVGLLHKIFFE